MNPKHLKSIRSFIGATDFDISRQFYKDFGFEEVPLGPRMSYFRMGAFGFYLQNAYVKDWVMNSMLFLEVEDLASRLAEIQSLHLDKTYQGVKVTEIVYNDWGNEFFVYDPSGILWHIGEFTS